MAAFSNAKSVPAVRTLFSSLYLNFEEVGGFSNTIIRYFVKLDNLPKVKNNNTRLLSQFRSKFTRLTPERRYLCVFIDALN